MMYLNLFKTKYLLHIVSNFKIDPSDLVVAVLALNPTLNESVKAGRLSENYLTSRICSRYPSRTLNYAGIRPNDLHADSSRLNLAMTQLVQRGILLRGAPALRWDFIVTPEEYFDSSIKTTLDPYLIKQIREFSERLN